MKQIQSIPNKIFSLPGLLMKIAGWRVTGNTIAFTNGCFDILHRGHIHSLSQAASEASILIVGLNSDNSVRRLKGPERPINHQDDRALLMASLVMVDAVVIFEEDTPLELIKAIRPDVLVKGGDYTVDQIVGASEVMDWGGRVVINSLVTGYSTTALIEKTEGK